MLLSSVRKTYKDFLDVISYSCKFLLNYSYVTTPLYQLLQNDTLWSFDKCHIKATSKLKEMITNHTVLQFYNPNLPTKITIDGSKHRFEPTREQNHNGKLLFHLPHVQKLLQNKTTVL